MGIFRSKAQRAADSLAAQGLSEASRVEDLPEAFRVEAMKEASRKPGANNCWCHFRRLDLEGTRLWYRSPYPLMPDAGVDALGAAKRNVKLLYQPLKPWQTRILTILPGHPDAPLDCKLWTAELIDKPGVAVSGTSDVVAYNALSYSWGRDSPTKIIACNDLTVLVNDSLALALIHMRQTRENVLIWCDALCINQSDPEEKAQQVRNMLRIFEKAKLVVAWIGLPGLPTGSLFHALDDGSPDPIVLTGPTTNPWLSPHASMNPNLPHHFACLEMASVMVKFARYHLGEPWFRRTWVRQEVFGANHLMIYCGVHTISLPKFIRGAIQLSIFEKDLQRKIGTSSPFDLPKGPLDVPANVSVLETSHKHAGTDRHDYQPPRQRLRYSAHWLQVLNQGADFDVTDPRDKVYGALGMITSPTTRLYVESRPDIQDAEFPISYTKSVSEVYQDVVKHLINLDRNLDVLQIFEDRRRRAKDLPSWVTDWRQGTRRSIVQGPPDDETERKRIGLAPHQDLIEIGKLRLTGVKTREQLIAVNIQQIGAVIPDSVRESRCMDSNYTDLVHSDCFVWGQFVRDRAVDTSVSTEWQRMLVPREVKLDDVLVALLGSSRLFLLRPVRQDEYEFIGPVHRFFSTLPDWSNGVLTFDIADQTVKLLIPEFSHKA